MLRKPAHERVKGKAEEGGTDWREEVEGVLWTSPGNTMK
jgi:hypothetical protein